MNKEWTETCSADLQYTTSSRAALKQGGFFKFSDVRVDSKRHLRDIKSKKKKIKTKKGKKKKKQ